MDESTESEYEIMPIDEEEREEIYPMFMMVLILIISASFAEIGRRPGRSGNFKRDRSTPITHIQSWDNVMFKRQMRISRLDFDRILQSISQDIYRDDDMATRSSGSPVHAILKLAITLRILAGATYVDMYWYGVETKSVMGIVVETCAAIYAHFHNEINLPVNDESQLLGISNDWIRIQEMRYGFRLVPGILLAGDGYIVKITEPKHVENTVMYRNRKNCFALIVQAFCDAFCRFRIFDIKWPGSISDLTAYTQTQLYHLMTSNSLPLWVCLVMDGIYSSCGGNHLTPFSSSVELRKADETDHTLYLKMITYNRVISAIRVTIERAFGQLVRRFGILWKPIELDISNVPLVVTTCAILHNICVNRWLSDGMPGSSTYGPDSFHHFDVSHATGEETDAQILHELKQVYDSMSVAMKHTNKRTSVMESIWVNCRIANENDLFNII